MENTNKKEKMLDNTKIRDVKDGEHRCSQTQCSYYLGQSATSCKKCSKCGASPFIINDSCKTCWDCENVPDELRFHDPKGTKEDIKNNAEKIFLELMKEAAEERLRQIAAEEKKGQKPIENITPKIEIIVPER